MFVKQLSKKEFYRLYFKTYALNGFAKLTNTEIRVLTEIITYNDLRLRPITPYAGKGRAEILESLGIQQSAFSNALSSLSKKDLLVKLAKKGDYALSDKVFKLKQYVDSNNKLSIVNYYQIVDDASDIRRSSKKAKSKAA